MSIVIQVIYVCPFYNLKTVSKIFLKPCEKCKGTLHLEQMLFLTELWHLLDVSAVAGHGTVFAALLFVPYVFSGI